MLALLKSKQLVDCEILSSASRPPQNDITRLSRGFPRRACTFSRTRTRKNRPDDGRIRTPTLSAWPVPRPSKHNLSRPVSPRHRRRSAPSGRPYGRKRRCSWLPGKLPRVRACARTRHAPENYAFVDGYVVLDTDAVSDPDVVRDIDILSQRTVASDDGSFLNMAEMPNLRSRADGHAIVDITAFVNEVVLHSQALFSNIAGAQ